jgi:NTP pyrophosphatase (non-canonical NTP hydrolase)
MNLAALTIAEHALENIEAQWATSSDTIDTLMEAVTIINRENGWFDSERKPLEDLMLITTEVAEAAEAVRNGEMELTYNENGKPEGFQSELADILIRLLDTCFRYEVDLTSVTIAKLRYNMKRGYRHGNKLA